MVAAGLIIRSRLRVLYQLVLLDIQVRMPFVVGRRGHGVQHPHDPWQALPVLQPRLARAGDRDDRDRHSAAHH
jgi:hypothetical protein